MDVDDLSKLLARARNTDWIKILSKDARVGAEAFLEAVEMINLQNQGVDIGRLLVLAVGYLQADEFPAPHFTGQFRKGALMTRRVIESLS